MLLSLILAALTTNLECSSQLANSLATKATFGKLNKTSSLFPLAPLKLTGGTTREKSECTKFLVTLNRLLTLTVTDGNSVSTGFLVKESVLVVKFTSLETTLLCLIVFIKILKDSFHLLENGF